MTFDAQLARIREKLEQVRRLDSRLEGFGSEAHHYRLGPPKTEEEVVAFEQRFGITLPAPYRAFITTVGDGPAEGERMGAGPFYGLFALGEGVGYIHDDPEPHLKNPSPLYPGLTDAEWAVMSEPLQRDEISDEEYFEAHQRIYAGLMIFCEQGCTYYSALVITGEHRGLVLNLDVDDQRPRFAYADDFLGWYERWLDELLDGTLPQPAYSFGYVRGGTEAELVADYLATTDVRTRWECLRGLGRLKSLTPQTLEHVALAQASDDEDTRDIATFILKRHRPPEPPPEVEEVEVDWPPRPWWKLW